jgi:hypothetical protein
LQIAAGIIGDEAAAVEELDLDSKKTEATAR